MNIMNNLNRQVKEAIGQIKMNDLKRKGKRLKKQQAKIVQKLFT